MSYYIGIDLGGTNIKAGITDEYGKIIKKTHCPTKSERGFDAVIKDMANLYFDLLASENLDSDTIPYIGIGCPGTINKEDGRVEFSNNLGWYGVDISKTMHKLTGKEILLENDANAAAFGEYMAGSLSGCDNALFLTIGTGVGSGIILNGRIYGGFNGMGGELGHMVIVKDGRKCTCGRQGCFEAYASASAFISLTKEKMLHNKHSLLWDICSGDIEKVNGLTAFTAYKLSDFTAIEVIEEYAQFLSNGIVSAVNILQPQAVAISGGLSGSCDILIPLIQKHFDNEVFTRHFGAQCHICKASLGNDAGIIGSALLKKAYKKG